MPEKSTEAVKTRPCCECGAPMQLKGPKDRRRKCSRCKAANKRGHGTGSGGRVKLGAAGVLARASASGGHGGGGGAISVNTSFYRDRQPGDGMPSVVVLRGDEDGALVAMRGDNGWVKPACPDLTVDRFAGYLAEHCGYSLADRDGQEVTLTRDTVREVSYAEAG
jgi:hypothetical protein